MSLPEPRAPGRIDWRRSTGVLAPAVLGALLLVAGILFGRVAVVGIGLTLLLGLAWSWSRRPNGRGRVELTEARSESDGRLHGSIRWQPTEGTEQLRIAVSAPGHRPVEAVLARPRNAVERVVGVSMGSVRTGRRRIFALTHVEVAPGQVEASRAGATSPLAVTVLPRAQALRELPLPPRLQGLTGPHGSSRPGDGGDLRDVNLFVPGDRLRRIDWRVTARRSSRNGPGPITDLYVRRTFATADATVMLVLDSRDEVGADVTTWGDLTRLQEDQPTSLDHARDAAATVARCYLEAGDRVGLEDLGRLRRPVPPAAGRRQLQRLRERIAVSEPIGEPRQRHRVPRLPSGSLIVIFSTFLDDEAVRLAQGWRGTGHRVIAVDTLPLLDTSLLDGRQQVALRIVLMERHDRLSELRRSDVEVVAWIHDETDPTSLPSSAALTALARRRTQR